MRGGLRGRPVSDRDPGSSGPACRLDLHASMCAGAWCRSRPSIAGRVPVPKPRRSRVPSFANTGPAACGRHAACVARTTCGWPRVRESTPCTRPSVIRRSVDASTTRGVRAARGAGRPAAPLTCAKLARALLAGIQHRSRIGVSITYVKSRTRPEGGRGRDGCRDPCVRGLPARGPRPGAPPRHASPMARTARAERPEVPHVRVRRGAHRRAVDPLPRRLLHLRAHLRRLRRRDRLPVPVGRHRAAHRPATASPRWSCSSASSCSASRTRGARGCSSGRRPGDQGPRRAAAPAHGVGARPLHVAARRSAPRAARSR